MPMIVRPPRRILMHGRALPYQSFRLRRDHAKQVCHVAKICGAQRNLRVDLQPDGLF
jgi:hypothetical protein